MLLILLAGLLSFSNTALAQTPPAKPPPPPVNVPAPKPPVPPRPPEDDEAAPTPGQIESETIGQNMPPLNSGGPAPTSSFSFQNEEITKVIEVYARLAGVKIIIDPNVRGRISIINPRPVTAQQAYDDLSLALSLESYGFSKVSDTLVLRSARNLQRGLIEVRTSLPPVKPERMITYILKLKHISAVGVNRDLRMLLSKDGELSPDANSNSLIISDWTSNIQRVHALMTELDVPANQKMIKKNAAAQERPTEKPKTAN